MIYTLLQVIIAQAGETATQPATTGATVAAQSPEPTLTNQTWDLLGPTIVQSGWGWGFMFLCIFIGLVMGRIAQTVLRSLGDRWTARGWAIRGALFRLGARPANLAIWAGCFGAGIPALYFPKGSSLQIYMFKFVGLLYIIALGWFLYNLVDLIDLALRRFTSKSHSKLDDTVVLLLRKALRIFLLVMMVLFVAQNVFDQNITSFLAGLGIAGLAVSLAAQDSIKNLFGSVTVLISRPFGLGDRIMFGAYDGVVENINFRDTKIRTLSGNLITVPNMKFTDTSIENISARPFVVRSMIIGLTYDTPVARVREAVERIRGVLNEPTILSSINLPDRPPRVFFKDFGASSLDVQVNYSYAITAPGNDWWTYMAHAQEVNLMIFEALNSAGIQIAFPTQTMYLASDPARQLSINLPDRNGHDRDASFAHSESEVKQ
jgi:MscS family membrane protein